MAFVVFSLVAMSVVTSFKGDFTLACGLLILGKLFLNDLFHDEIEEVSDNAA